MRMRGLILLFRLIFGNTNSYSPPKISWVCSVFNSYEICFVKRKRYREWWKRDVQFGDHLWWENKLFLTVTSRFSDAIINTINNFNLQSWKDFYGHWKRCMIWFYVMWHSQKRRDEINLSLEKNKKFVKRDGVDEMIFRDYGSCLF